MTPVPLENAQVRFEPLAPHHVLNHRSRRAIERLGARTDGILRTRMRMPNGTLRDTACHSITEAEWPTVRAHLDHLLAR